MTPPPNAPATGNVISTIAEWRTHVTTKRTADELNNLLAFLHKGATVYQGWHPFKGDELQHARNIVFKHARTLPVTFYESKREYRDNQIESK